MAFLVALATDPMKHEAYLADAEAAMLAAGLSEDERAIVRSGDQRTIYTRLTNPALPSSSPPVSLPSKDS